MVNSSRKMFFSNRKNTRQKDLSVLLGIIVILLLLNVIGQGWFFRLDLTSEKRYTLSAGTKEILKSLDDVVYVRVYLAGDLNIPFKNFQGNIRDMLDEFKIYGRSRIQYEIINPYEDTAPNMREEIISNLFEKGLRPANIHQRDKEGAVTEKIIFPGAIIAYEDTEVPVNLLVNNPGLSAEQNLNNSVENLEYILISTIKSISNPDIEKIAFIEGHGELREMDVQDISVELSKSFQIDRGTIKGKPGVLDDYKAIIIANPQKPFSEQDKFVIDQYIMKGGKVLWLVNTVKIRMDSLVNGETLAFIKDLNLEDMFFRYGIRILPELVQDIQCNVIPVNVALSGSEPNFQPVPWLYYPLINPNPKHPVSRNLNLVLCRFAEPIDTLAARRNIRKKTLLASSAYSKTKKVPSVISLAELDESPRREDFNRSFIPVGVLLEGEFESVFNNRGLDAYFDSIPHVIPSGRPTRMAVISDGEFISNDIINSSQGLSVLPLGYDRYTQQTFGNKDFLLNLIQYLTDDNNLLELRGRDFKLRLLDKQKITSQRKKWILLNMILPSFLIICFGIIYSRYRKYLYSNQKDA